MSPRQLLERLARGQGEERVQAVESLMELGARGLMQGQVVAGTLGQAFGPSDEELRALAEPLGRVFATQDILTRMAAYFCLQALGPEAVGALPWLSRALEDPREDVRQQSAELLAGLGPLAEPALPALLAALGDEGREDARGWVAQAVGRLAAGSARVDQALRGLEEHPNPYVREGASLAREHELQEKGNHP